MAVRRTPQATPTPTAPALTCHNRNVEVLDPSAVCALVEEPGGGTMVYGRGWAFRVDQHIPDIKKALGK